jgi:hypothetical protein
MWEIIMLEDHVLAFVVVRGSVPVFWEQPGVQVSMANYRLYLMACRELISINNNNTRKNIS